MIQMPVIHGLDDLIIDNVFEKFQVNNHSCHLIGFAIQRYFEDVIVPMPVARGALTVQVAILLLGKARIVAAV